MDYWAILRTPFGWCGLVTSRYSGIKEVILPVKHKTCVAKRIKRDYSSALPNSAKLSKFIRPLQAYFRGKQVEFKFPLDISNFTPFQKSVYKKLMNVKFGEVRTYGWLARQIGRGRAARAVGNALAKNPIPVIIPCHRIIPASPAGRRSVGNFSALGGPSLKRKLLALEGVCL